MRYSASEKYEIIRLVEESSLPIQKTLRQLDIHKSTFYNWLKGTDKLTFLTEIIPPMVAFYATKLFQDAKARNRNNR